MTSKQRKFLLIAIALLLAAIIMMIMSSMKQPVTPDDPGAGGFGTFPQGQQATTTVQYPEEFLLEDDLLPGASQTSFAPVLSLVWNDYYFVRECDNADEGAALILYGKNTRNNRGVFDIDEVMEAVRNAEPDMLEVVGPVIFPIDFDSSSATILPFRTVSVSGYLGRTADIAYLGKEYDLYYGWMENRVIFTSSENCFAETMEAFDLNQDSGFH